MNEIVLFADTIIITQRRIIIMNCEKNSCAGSSKEHIKGICCDVKNCAFHDGQNECYAGTICVGPCEANCSANTSCATFKPKQY